MAKTKQIYRVIHAGYVIEGEASSPQNAVRKAISLLMKQHKIQSPPESRWGWWKGVQCQILDKDGMPKKIKHVGATRTTN